MIPRGHYKVYLCGTETPDAGPYRGKPGPQHGPEVRNCPREAEHNYGPAGYMDWVAWADASSKKFRKMKCDGCGRWLLIEPKPPRKKASVK